MRHCPVYVVWCLIMLSCHVRPRSLSKPVSIHPRSLSHPKPRLIPVYSGFPYEKAISDVPILARTDGDPGSSSAHLWRNMPSSLDIDRPSSSGPFTRISLPPEWMMYPFTAGYDISPVLLTASVLEVFYTRIIEECGRLLWSAAPTKTPMVLSIGQLVITVTGSAKREGLPWGVLALLAQGMLERARR